MRPTGSDWKWIKSEFEFLVVPYESFDGLHWKVVLLPFLELQGFLKVSTEIAPEEFLRGALILKDLLVPFFLESPEGESWNELPKGVEENTIVGSGWPVANDNIEIFRASIVPSAFEAQIVPYEGS